MKTLDNDAVICAMRQLQDAMTNISVSMVTCEEREHLTYALVSVASVYAMIAEPDEV